MSANMFLNAGSTGSPDIVEFLKNFDWNKTPLGIKTSWSESCIAVTNSCLRTKFPVSILWGKDLIQIYNQAFCELIGDKHPLAFGAKAQETWAAIWPLFEPYVKESLQTGSSFKIENIHASALNRRGNLNLLYDLFGSAILGADNKIEGVLIAVGEVPSLKTSASGKPLHRSPEHFNLSEDPYAGNEEKVQDYAVILLDQEGLVRTWNKAAEKMKQYQESEILGRSFQVFYLEEDRASGLPEKLMRRAKAEGRALHEGWRLRKDKSRFWGSITLTALYDDNHNVTGYSKVVRDLTERKLAEDQLHQFAQELQRKNEALRKSEERYHKMIGEVEDYAIILLNVDGNVENWNVGAEKIKGYTEQEILGKNFSIFYPPEDRENLFPQKLLAQAREKGKALHEGWRVRKDGSRFWGSIVITALHNSDGSVLGFSKVTRDLTERKKAEDKMQEYLLELEAQNRELEQFAYVASHDLQEPLRKIQTFADIIENNLDDHSMVNRYLNKLNSSASRMTELIKSVLNYSRLSRNGEEMHPTDLNQILSHVKADYELLIQEKSGKVESGLLPVIHAIPLQMNQLFSNIIGNALKYTERNPVINISSRIVDSAEIVHKPPALPEGNYTEIVFADNGIGFDQRYESIIFAMFQRLHGKQEFSGTGIGLALCKKIMEAHSGFITATSEIEIGSKFYVYFPASPGGA
jgi:PAS domain S-box-containing protein